MGRLYNPPTCKGHHIHPPVLSSVVANDVYKVFRVSAKMGNNPPPKLSESELKKDILNKALIQNLIASLY